MADTPTVPVGQEPEPGELHEQLLNSVDVSQQEAIWNDILDDTSGGPFPIATPHQVSAPGTPDARAPDEPRSAQPPTPHTNTPTDPTMGSQQEQYGVTPSHTNTPAEPNMGSQQQQYGVTPSASSAYNADPNMGSQQQQYGATPAPRHFSGGFAPNPNMGGQVQYGYDEYGRPIMGTPYMNQQFSGQQYAYRQNMVQQYTHPQNGGQQNTHPQNGGQQYRGQSQAPANKPGISGTKPTARRKLDATALGSTDSGSNQSLEALTLQISLLLKAQEAQSVKQNSINAKLFENLSSLLKDRHFIGPRASDYFCYHRIHRTYRRTDSECQQRPGL